VVMLRQRILNITDRTLRQRRTARTLAEVFAASGAGMEWNDAPVVRSRHMALMTVGFTAPPIARQAYPQLCFNVHLQGWIGNQYQHTAMTQSAREPTLRAKPLPSALIPHQASLLSPRDWSRTCGSTTGPCWVRLISTSRMCLSPSDPRVASQHQAKPERVENSLSSLLHVYGNPVKMWTRCGSAGAHLMLGTCRSTLGTLKMIL
jgi:hypothetical protein